MQKTKGLITIIGSSKADEKQLEAAGITARILAEEGWGLMSGGRGGVMESAARAHSEAGGFSIGMLPGDDKTDGNPYNSLILPTGIGFARNMSNVLAGEGVIVVGGGPGTLSELGYALIYCKPLLMLSFLKGVSAFEESVIREVDSGASIAFIRKKNDLGNGVVQWLNDL